MLRILGLASHAKMKYNILKSISLNLELDYSRFVSGISKFKRDLQIDKKQFDHTILATAAPSCYAKIIAINENFEVCQGTEFPISSFDEKFENRKEVKKFNIVAFLEKKGIDGIDTFVTDHLDDLPLMKLSANNIIVHPDRNFEHKLKQHHVEYKVFITKD